MYTTDGESTAVPATDEDSLTEVCESDMEATEHEDVLEPPEKKQCQ